MAEGRPNKVVFVDPLVAEGANENAFYFGLAGVAEGGADMVFYRRQMDMERFPAVERELASRQLVVIPGLGPGSYMSELAMRHLNHPSGRYIHCDSEGNLSLIYAKEDGADLRTEPAGYGRISAEGLEAQTEGSKDALIEIKKYIDEVIGP